MPMLTVRPPVYPFVALTGQETMKLALILNAVAPGIGGVLLRGEKGTAKSTAARGLAALLPPTPAVSDCGYRCAPDAFDVCPVCRQRALTARPVTTLPAPFVDLPLGATEDMLLGGIDFESTLREGRPRFLPGLLARAHRGVMYVDEVNLLDDHLVEGILDTVESGINLVEREGVSEWHPSAFILIGTMNPEEGELRPQLLDRFGMAVNIEAERDAHARVDLLRAREEYDRNPQAYATRFECDTEDLSQRIQQARERYAAVRLPGAMRGFIAELCLSRRVAGHRADLALERAARAHAAWTGRSEVTDEDVTAVAFLVLAHRERPPAPPPPPPPPESTEQEGPDSDTDDTPECENEPDESDPQDNHEEPSSQPPAPPPERMEDEDNEEPDAEDERAEHGSDSGTGSDAVQEIGSPFQVRPIAAREDRQLRTGSGKRSRTRSATKRGRYVRSTLRRGKDDLALDATLRAAAPHQLSRRQRNGMRGMAVHIEADDVREKIRERRIGNFLLFVVDASGSMGARRRMVETKAAVMSLLLDAYQKRDRVGLVAFRGEEGEVLLPPTASVDMAAKLLANMSVGGRTPLSAGLVSAAQTLDTCLQKDPAMQPVVILLTDGKANRGLGDEAPHREALRIAAGMGERYERCRFIVVDTEEGGAVRLDLAGKLAVALGGEYMKTEELRAEDLVKLARMD